MELAVQPVFSYVLRVSSLSGTTVVLVLNGRFNIQAATDTKHSLFIHIKLVAVCQIVLNTAVTLVRMLCMYLLHKLSDLFVFLFSVALLAAEPAVVGGSGYTKQVTR